MFNQFVFDNVSVFLRRRYADIATGPVLDRDAYFPESRALRDNFDAIQKEALALFQGNLNIPRFHDISSTQYRISANDGKNWRMFMLKVYGRAIEPNCSMAPELARFLQATPNVTTAALSYLEPGKHIPPHKGPFRGILRYHICLYAPDTTSDNPPWLAVDGQKISYSEGGDLLWDDTYMHEVLNPGPNPRIALLLDVRRPVTRLLHRVFYRMMMIGGWIYASIYQGKLRVNRPDAPPNAS